MTAEAFRAKRRQKFLTEQYFKLNQTFLQLLLDTSNETMKESILAHEPDPSSAGGIFKDKLKLLKLHYTAGRPIEELKPLYSDVMNALGEWHAAEHEYSKWLAKKRNEDLRLDMTPLELEDLYHYQLAIDVVSLGVLFGEGDALRQCALWMQSARGTDLLFEFLLEPAVLDPRESTEYFHTSPYDPLIDAIYALETPREASAKVKEYLEGWYRSFDGAPWHDGHLHAVEGEYMPYYGYWSFEAAAVCVINGIDDSTFRDHLLYPKDLADWARANHSLANLKPGASKVQGIDSRPTRVPGGEYCPQAGWWFTPASTGSRRYFKQGEVMPIIEGSDYGSTFWQWDFDQSAPAL
ncbi:PoNe immunity protein domain-containing protein [Variovorax sp. GB1P17]|uniref:PoNe immunity protein domain-containing protein n=1 Tax=Variovorax sp. GB1P17 TaxID=3443740 RepID=UPI003F474AC1